MGLLDDLKKQAAAKEEKAKQQQAELKAQETYYEQHLRKVMRQAHDYFLELVTQLNIVAPEVSPAYSIVPPQQVPIILKQEGYVFRSDNTERPRNLTVRCECRLEKPVEFYVQTRAAVNSYAALLDSHAFPHYTRNEMDDRLDVANATFVLEGPMRVQFRMLASPEDRCIYIDLLNIDTQPQKRYKLNPESVDEALLDRLARMLLREETTLVEVGISDDARAALREKLEHEARLRAEERARREAESEAERRAEEEARILNRARRSINRILSKDS